MSGLAQRLVTGSIFVIVMIAGLYGGYYAFIGLVALMSIVCIWELLGLILPNNKTGLGLFRKIVGLGIGMMPFTSTIYSAMHNDIPSAFMFTLFTLSIFSLLLFELFAKAEKPFDNIAYILLATFYIGFPFSLLFQIWEAHSSNVILGMLFLVWTNDSFAYLVGRKIGKTPLFPRISPKKTWEGSIGGVLFTFIMALLLYLVFTDLSLINWLVIAFIMAVFGALGDLVESMFKRSIHIKDSGNLLPGHGGALDRFDAFLFAIPFVAMYLLLIGNG